MDNMKKNYYLVTLIFLVFFMISFLTNILGSINPNVSDSFRLSGTLTGLLPFSFFIAYAFMSIPSGMIVQHYGEKKSMISAWILAALGSILFAFNSTFSIFLISLFLIGCAMALLQVAINPLLRVSGGEKNFAFLSVFAQLIFGIASFVSPMVYAYLEEHLSNADHANGFITLLNKITPSAMSWVSLYWLFAAVSVFMILIITLSRFPKVKRNEDEIVGAWDIHRKLFKRKTVILYFIGIFAYVGSEQGIANWISEFLRTYHNFRPEVEGAHAVSQFWGLMTVGCFFGMWLLKILDSKIVLRIFSVASLVVLSLTLWGNAGMALIGFPALGFCLSVMWSIIFSLALNSLEAYQGTFSGIICTAIAGGAIITLIIGKIKDLIGLREGMLILFLTLGYVLSISIWAHPLIRNETISSKKKQKKPHEKRDPIF